MDLDGVDEVVNVERISQTDVDPECVNESPQDDDPKNTIGTKVVREIDVLFRTVDPKTQLYVLQYPPFVQPDEFDERCQEVRLNPQTSEVEFDYPLIWSHIKSLLTNSILQSRSVQQFCYPVCYKK